MNSDLEWGGGGGEREAGKEREGSWRGKAGNGSSKKTGIIYFKCVKILSKTRTRLKKLRLISGKIRNPFTVVTSYIMKCCHLSCQKTWVRAARL